MRRFEFAEFGLDHLREVECPDPQPGPGEIVVAPSCVSLNYRDLLVVRGHYNPRLDLPAVPISDGAGVVTAVGDGVDRVAPGSKVVSHFVAGWKSGAYRAEYQATTLGTPGPGWAAEQVLLPEHAVVPSPTGMDACAASTLPIAALTAWSALVTEGNLQPGQSILTLGTGGVSVFAVQIAKAMGARVFITSSSDPRQAGAGSRARSWARTRRSTTPPASAGTRRCWRGPAALASTWSWRPVASVRSIAR